MKPVNAYLGYDPTRISRVSDIDSSKQSWDSVLFQQGKSIMDFDLNVMQNILTNNISSLAQSIFDVSGFFKNPDISIDSGSGRLTLPASDVSIFGKLVRVSSKSGGELQMAKNSSLSATSNAFYWLEVWFQEIVPSTVVSETINPTDTTTYKESTVYYYGGELIDNAPAAQTNPLNTLLDPIYGAETSRRVQIRWRLRCDAAPINNDLATTFITPTVGDNTNGNIKAQGGRSTTWLTANSTYSFYRSDNYSQNTNPSVNVDYSYRIRDSLLDFSKRSDTGLFVAGTGTADDAKQLNTVDGRVYGIPIAIAVYQSSVSGSSYYLRPVANVVGIKTGSVIAGGSATIGSHVSMNINEGWSAKDSSTTLWDRVVFTAKQEQSGRPNASADIYMIPYDVPLETTVDKIGYVIPKRMSVYSTGSVDKPSLTFEAQDGLTPNGLKTRRTGLSYQYQKIPSTADNDSGAFVVHNLKKLVSLSAIAGSVDANEVVRFYRGTIDSVLMPNEPTTDAGLKIIGSTISTVDTISDRRVIAGYDSTIVLDDLNPGSGLIVRTASSSIALLGALEIRTGGTGYFINELVEVQGTSGTKAIARVSKTVSEPIYFTGTIVNAGTSIGTVSNFKGLEPGQIIVQTQTAVDSALAYLPVGTKIASIDKNAGTITLQFPSGSASIAGSGTAVQSMVPFRVDPSTSGATFTASISSTTLTITAGSVSGSIQIGQTISGVGVKYGTKITAGSAQSWTVSISQTVTPAVAMRSTGPLSGSVAELVVTQAGSGYSTNSDLETINTSRFQTSKIKKLYSDSIVAENVRFSKGTLLGSPDQLSGVDIIGQINANARIEFRIDNSVSRTNQLKTGITEFPKKRIINFNQGNLIRLAGNTNSTDNEDIFNLTISGELDAFSGSEFPSSPTYYFTSGRLVNNASNANPKEGYGTSALLTDVLGGLSGASTISENSGTISIVLTDSSGGAYTAITTPYVVRNANPSLQNTLTTFALNIQTQIRAATTLTGTTIPLSNASVSYNQDLGLIFKTNSAAVFKSITATGTSAQNSNILEILKLSPTIYRSSTLSSNSDVIQFSTTSNSSQTPVSELSKGMIVESYGETIPAQSWWYTLQHTFVGTRDGIVGLGGTSPLSDSFSIAAIFKNECVLSISPRNGRIVEASMPTITAGGSGYRVGDVLRLTGGGGLNARLRVTTILTPLTTNNVTTGSVASVSIIDSGSGYIANSSVNTVRQDYVTILNILSDTQIQVDYTYLSAGTTFSKNLKFYKTLGEIGLPYFSSGDTILSEISPDYLLNTTTGLNKWMSSKSLPSDVWVEGRSNLAARRDHRHLREGYYEGSATTLPTDNASATSGSLQTLTISRGDHTHQWPSRLPQGFGIGQDRNLTDIGAPIGSGLEIYGITGPVRKDYNGDSSALTSGLLVWDTDTGYNSTVDNIVFQGRIDNGTPGNAGFILTVGSLNDILKTVSAGQYVYYTKNVNSGLISEELLQVVSEILVSGQSTTPKTYNLSGAANTSPYAAVGGSGYVQMFARGTTQTVLPDVGGRISFGGRTDSSASGNYAVFAAIRGGKYNNIAYASGLDQAKYGYISLSARWSNVNQQPRLTEVLRGNGSGGIYIGNPGIESLSSGNTKSDPMTFTSQATGGIRLVRIAGSTLIDDQLVVNHNGVIVNEIFSSTTTGSRGLTVNITTTQDTKVSGAIINVAGTGLAAGEIYAIVQSGASGASVRIESVGGSDNHATVISLYTYGSGYTSGTALETSRQNNVAQNPYITISGTSYNSVPVFRLQQRNNEDNVPVINNVASATTWNTYVENLTGHYTVSLDNVSNTRFTNNIVFQLQKSIGVPGAGAVPTLALFHTDMQIGSFYNNPVSTKTLSFQVRRNTALHSSSPTPAIETQALSWKLLADNDGDTHKVRSFSLNAYPLQTATFSELESAGDSDKGFQGQPSGLTHHLQTWSLPTFTESSGATKLSYTKLVTYNANVSINGDEIIPLTPSTFYGTSPENIFEVYQGTTDRPWRLGTKSTVLTTSANTDGGYSVAIIVTTAVTGNYSESETVTFSSRSDSLFGVYGFYAGQRVAMSAGWSIAFPKIISVNYSARTITLEGYATSNGTATLTGVNYPGGLKGIFSSSENIYSLSFMDRADKIYNTARIEAKDFYFNTGIHNTTQYGANTAESTSKMYLSSDGKLGLRTISPYALMQINNKSANDFSHIYDTFAGEGYGYYGSNTAGVGSNNATITVVATTTANSPLITVNSNSGLMVGQIIKYFSLSTGSGSSLTFPAGTMIVKISGTTITLSNNATLSGVITVRIGYPLPLLVTDQFPTSSSRLNDFKPILMLQREATGGENYAAGAAFSLSRYESADASSGNSVDGSRTRLDISLAHTSFTDIVQNTIMTIQSNGFVGIGKNIQKIGANAAGPAGTSYSNYYPWTTLAVTRTTTQDDRYGIIHATTNVGSSGSNNNASVTSGNNSITSQLMSYGTLGTRVGNYRTGNSTGNLYLTYGNNSLGMFIQGTTAGTVNSSSGSYYKSGWITVGDSYSAPNGPLHIYETVGKIANPHYGSLVFEHSNAGGSSSILFKSGSNKGTSFGAINFRDANRTYGTGLQFSQSDLTANANGKLTALVNNGLSGYGYAVGDTFTLTQQWSTYTYNSGWYYGPSHSQSIVVTISSVTNIGCPTSFSFPVVADQPDVTLISQGFYSSAFASSAFNYTGQPDGSGNPTGSLYNGGLYSISQSVVLITTLLAGNPGKNGRIELNVEVPAQDDNFGIVNIYSNSSTNVSLTVSNGLTSGENGVTGQFMAEGTNGLRIGNRIKTGANLGNLYLTYADDTVGQFVQGLDTGTSLAGDGTYHRAGWTGIGTVIPTGLLHLYEPTGTTASPHYGTLVLEHNNANGASSIVFKSKATMGTDYGYIQYQESDTAVARLSLGVEVAAQNDNYGIVDVYSSASQNVSLTVSNGRTLAENGATGQFMAEGTNGLRIGNRIKTGTNLGNLYLTYANDIVGQFVQGLNSGTTFATDGTYHRAGWTGIGTVLPTGLLHLYEPTGTVNSPHYGTLVLEHGNAGGASSIVFKSSGSNNSGSDYGYIQYQSASTVGTDAATEKSRFIIGVQNDARADSTASNTLADDIVVNASGSIIGQGSGVSGLFAPRVSIPAQSFVASSVSGGENLTPTFSYWQVGSPVGNDPAVIKSGWNRFELRYSPSDIMSADATIQLPFNFTPNSLITFRITWYQDGTAVPTGAADGVSWKISVLPSSPLRFSGSSYSNSGRTNNANGALVALSTVTDKAPSDSYAYVETVIAWAPTAAAPFAYPGDILGVRLTRAAQNVTDTYAGSVVFNNLVIEFGADISTLPGV